ncbi:uncharacterized protein G2W53_041246 [Senna tora]|uniref:Uncharacterized protein n=1 Tax=Senna tora TaxID=362788 RepID=A0A834SDF0_9FABA|nr:uncharacterized protein G2W53_041246 [Senna tora]
MAQNQQVCNVASQQHINISLCQVRNPQLDRVREARRNAIVTSMRRHFPNFMISKTDLYWRLNDHGLVAPRPSKTPGHPFPS